tara:strand:+ start:6684 stop:6842 length:159 start_codon:yes stop_codon:yes gene_type:complete
MNAHDVFLIVGSDIKQSRAYHDGKVKRIIFNLMNTTNEAPSFLIFIQLFGSV